MAIIPLNWRLGIDNVSSKTNLPHGAVVDAVNTDIDRASTLSRRSGYALVQASMMHDVWTSESRHQSFAIIDGKLCKINMPWSMTVLYALKQDAPFYFTEVNDDIICGSRYETIVIAPDLSLRYLGLEDPGAPGVLPGAAGGLDAGRYGVAISYLRNAEEGGLSDITFCTLTVGQGLQLTIPQPSGTLPTGVRIYRTQADGDVLHRVTDIPLLLGQYLLGVTPIGRHVTVRGMARMIPGEFVRYWRGMLWTVRGNVAYHSEPMRYGVYSPRFNFVQLQSAIRVFEPVEGGIWIGTKDGMYFLSGKEPKDFAVEKTGGLPPVKGTGRRIPTSMLGTLQAVGEDGGGRELFGEYVALWLAGNGFIIGTGDGHIFEWQRRRIQLNASAGATAVFDRRVVAVVS